MGKSNLKHVTISPEKHEILRDYNEATGVSLTRAIEFCLDGNPDQNIPPSPHWVKIMEVVEQWRKTAK